MRHPARLTAVLLASAAATAAAAPLGAQGAPARPVANRGSAATDAQAAATVREAWDAFAKKDSARMARLVPDGGSLVGYDGISTITAASLAGAMRACETRAWTVDSVHARALSPTLVLATYVGTADQTCNGQIAPAKVYATDVLERRGGRWVALHHQETPAKAAP